MQQKKWLNISLILCFCAFAVVLIISLDIIGLKSDLGLYEASGKSIRLSEYPPLATTIFKLLVYMPGITFVQSWFVLYMLFVVATVVYMRFTSLVVQLWHLPLALLVAAIAFGSDIMFARFDYIIALLLFLTWQAFTGKRFGHSAVFLVTAVFLKLVPIIIWPLLFLYTPRPQRVLVLKVSVVTALVLLLIPIFVLGFETTIDNAVYMFSYHQERGVGMESTWSSIHLLYRSLINEKAYIGFHHGAWHNDDLYLLGGRFKVLMILSLLTVIAWVTKQRDFFLSMVLVFIVFYITTPVFSPQFLVWVVPLIIIWWLQQPVFRRHSVFGIFVIVVTYAIAFASFLVYPLLYKQIFQEQLLVPIVIMLLRQILLAVLGIAIFLHLRRHGEEVER